MSDNAPTDVEEGRKGEWMHVSTGGRFYPLDPRKDEIFIEDIANGLALDCRYAGQGKVDSFLSVAEHCVLLARWAEDNIGASPALCLAILLHDASEAYLNDLPRAVKHAVNGTYSKVEGIIQTMIYEKYGIQDVAKEHAAIIKELDCRIVQHEKAEIMEYPQPWAFDKGFNELPGMVIRCWSPAKARAEYLSAFARYRQKLAEERINMEAECLIRDLPKKVISRRTRNKSTET